MKRYRLGTSIVSGIGQMYEDSEGTWVTWADAEKLLTARCDWGCDACRDFEVDPFEDAPSARLGADRTEEPRG